MDSNQARRNERESYDGMSMYEIENPPSTKSARKMQQQQISSAEKVMQTAISMLEKLNERKERKEQNADTHNEDQSFTNLIYHMLWDIPNNEEKAMLKLEIQQEIVSLKYSKHNHMSQRNETRERSPFSPCVSKTLYTTINETGRYQTISTAAETSSLNLPPSTFNNISFPCKASVIQSPSCY